MELLVTAEKVIETAKTIQKVSNVSKEMKTVAESEGKDQVMATKNLAVSTASNMQQGENIGKGEKNKLKIEGDLYHENNNRKLLEASFVDELDPSDIGEAINIEPVEFIDKLPIEESAKKPEFKSVFVERLSSSENQLEEVSVKDKKNMIESPSRNETVEQVSNNPNDVTDSTQDTLTDRELNKSLGEKSMGIIPRNGGEWSGEPGNSTWKPDREISPSNRNYSNTEGKTWGEILDEYGIDGIPFNDGEPDFSEVSKGTVEIDNFSDARYGVGGNFDQADEKLAQQRGCTKEEVRQWREENNYTWHERSDCKTMDKVPREVHGNIAHSGGISKMRNQ